MYVDDSFQSFNDMWYTRALFQGSVILLNLSSISSMVLLIGIVSKRTVSKNCFAYACMLHCLTLTQKTPHQSIQPGQIALNAIQRRHAKVSAGDTLSVTRLECLLLFFNFHHLQLLEINLMHLISVDSSPLMNFSWPFLHLSWNSSKKELKVNRHAFKLVYMIFFSPLRVTFLCSGSWNWRVYLMGMQIDAVNLTKQLRKKFKNHVSLWLLNYACAQSSVLMYSSPKVGLYSCVW